MRKYKVRLWFYVRILCFGSNGWRHIYSRFWLDGLVVAGDSESTCICFEVELSRNFVLRTIILRAIQAVFTELRLYQTYTRAWSLISLLRQSNAAFCDLFILLKMRQQLCSGHFRVLFCYVFWWSFPNHSRADIVFVYITHTLFFGRGWARSFLVSFLLL